MADLGEKHICADCDTRYYDLGRPDATCPKCGGVNRVDEEVALASTLGRRSPRRPSPQADEPDEATSEDEDEEDEELLAELENEEEEDEEKEEDDEKED